jgi:hypothetical protein
VLGSAVFAQEARAAVVFDNFDGGGEFCQVRPSPQGITSKPSANAPHTPANLGPWPDPPTPFQLLELGRLAEPFDWIKIKNPTYSQGNNRHELFEGRVR